MAYAANAVTFDGTNDYLDHGTMSGVADSKVLTFSFWVLRGATGADQSLYANTGQRILVRFSSNNTIFVQGRNTSASTVLSCASTVSITDTTTWHHVAGSFNLVNAGDRHLYIDGVDRTGTGTHTDQLMDWTRNDNWMGNRNNGSDKFDGDIADFWIDNSQFIDLSVTANLEDFRDSSGCPVDLGSDGSTPTGTAPRVYLTGATATWHTNAGLGNGFTEVGALSDAGSSPSDGCNGGLSIPVAQHGYRMRRVGCI